MQTISGRAVADRGMISARTDIDVAIAKTVLLYIYIVILLRG